MNSNHIFDSICDQHFFLQFSVLTLSNHVYLQLRSKFLEHFCKILTNVCMFYKTVHTKTFINVKVPSWYILKCRIYM